MRFIAAATLTLAAAIPAAAQESEFRYNFDSWAPALAIEVDGTLRPAALFFAGPAASAPVTPADPSALTPEECQLALGYFPGPLAFADADGVLQRGALSGCVWREEGGVVRTFALADGPIERPVAAGWTGVADLGNETPAFNAWGRLAVGESEAFRRVFTAPDPAAGGSPTVRFAAGGDATTLTPAAPGATVSWAVDDPFVAVLWYAAADGTTVWWKSGSTNTTLTWSGTP